MPELLEDIQPAPEVRSDSLPAAASRAPASVERLARDDLRRQIAELERRLGETFAAAFPRQGIDWRVGAVGGPRVLGIRDLERVRDALAFRLADAQAEVGRRAEVEDAYRGLLEEMVAAPERHRWERISNEDLGEPGCKSYWSLPRFGILGMLLDWWRVKVSSGCPLAGAGWPPRLERGPSRNNMAGMRRPMSGAAAAPSSGLRAFQARCAARRHRPACPSTTSYPPVVP